MESKLVNGVKIYAPKSRSDLIDFVFAHRSLLVAVNAEKILHASDETRGIINRNVGYPDGLGAVMGLKRKGLAKVIKIPGCELWLDIVRAHHRDKCFYLIGGKDPIIAQTVAQLSAEFPGIQIVNYRNGYLTGESERKALIDDVVRRKPDVVFVAMGSPRQELLMEAMRQRHSAVYLGLGGSFDVYTGQVKRAPPWWVEHHVEWLFRLLQEPKRVLRQVRLLKFLILLITARF